VHCIFVSLEGNNNFNLGQDVSRPPPATGVQGSGKAVLTAAQGNVSEPIWAQWCQGCRWATSEITAFSTSLVGRMALTLTIELDPIS